MDGCGAHVSSLLIWAAVKLTERSTRLSLPLIYIFILSSASGFFNMGLFWEGKQWSRKKVMKGHGRRLFLIGPPWMNIVYFRLQDENAAAQGVLAVHGGPVRHLLPPLLQGPPLCLPAARALRSLPQHQVLHHGHGLLLEGEGRFSCTAQPGVSGGSATFTCSPSVGTPV